MNNKGLLPILLLVLMAVPVFAESPTGVEIQTEMPDVQVWVDGTFAGTTREFRPGNNLLRVVDLQPGSHTVECRLERYQPFVTTVEVTQSTIQPVVVRFTFPETEAIGIQSAAGELQAQTGSIRVLSDPTGAVVELDGQRQTALTDLLLTPVTVGPHRIRAYFDGDTEDEKLSIEVTVPPDGEIEVGANFWDRTIRTNATYSIHLRSNVESAVFIDEAEAGSASPEGGRFTLTNGNHTIELRSPGYEIYRRSVDLTGDEFISVDMTPIEHRVSISSVLAGVPVVQVLPDGSRKSVGRSPVTVAVAAGISIGSCSPLSAG